jgi:hypothetical protein
LEKEKCKPAKLSAGKTAKRSKSKSPYLAPPAKTRSTLTRSYLPNYTPGKIGSGIKIKAQ